MQKRGEPPVYEKFLKIPFGPEQEKLWGIHIDYDDPNADRMIKPEDLPEELQKVEI